MIAKNNGMSAKPGNRAGDSSRATLGSAQVLVISGLALLALQPPLKHS